MTVWTGSEVGMRHKEAVWLSLPTFYSAVKQFVEEHQCRIALFETDEVIYSMQVLGLTQTCRAIKYLICKNFLHVWLILFIFKRILFLCKNSLVIRTENVALSQALSNSTEYLVYVIVGACWRKPEYFTKTFLRTRSVRKANNVLFLFSPQLSILRYNTG